MDTAGPLRTSERLGIISWVEKGLVSFDRKVSAAASWNKSGYGPVVTGEPLVSLQKHMASSGDILEARKDDNSVLPIFLVIHIQ